MLQKSNTTDLYYYHNPDGILLTMNSDYKHILAELKSINVDYKNKIIEEIIKELIEIRTLYYLEFCDKNNVLDPEIIDDDDFIKINFLVEYMDNLKLFFQ